MSELIERQATGLAARPSTEVATSRATQEVQGAIMMARRFPRDAYAAHNRIMQACKRRKLAEDACYAYPRGGQTVTGPSIRLAEVLAQSWGNLDFGIIELEQRNGESEVMAYAWDLETNVRQTKVFQVQHLRRSRGENKRLVDPRDIYEMVANQGARRLRACILGVIPGDVVDDAVSACEKTLAGGDGKPIADRIKAMVEKFSEHGVTTEMLEERLGHKLAATTETELVNLRKIWTSLTDGMSARWDWFDAPGPTGDDSKEATERVREAIKKPKETPKNDGLTRWSEAWIRAEFDKVKLKGPGGKERAKLEYADTLGRLSRLAEEEGADVMPMLSGVADEYEQKVRK